MGIISFKALPINVNIILFQTQRKAVK